MAVKEKKADSIGETIKTVVYALLIAGVVRTLFFQPFWIPSSSMKPTLLIGDFLFVNKMAYGYSKYSCPWSICPITGRIFATLPERGDIVVFKHPTSNSDFIKRLIGLPGDRVQMKNGVLYLNDQIVPQQPAGLFSETFEKQGPMRSTPSCANAPVGFGATCEKNLAIETLPNGVAHAVLNIGNTRADNTPVFTVPAEKFFFMGDNRDNSGDSRFFGPRDVGFVPFDRLVGRAKRVVFSSSGRWIPAFWTWRSDRYFKRLD